MSQAKDRDDLIEDADPTELDQIKLQRKKPPKSPDDLYTRAQLLTPKIEERELGHGGRRASFAAKAAKARKEKSAIESMEQRRDACRYPKNQ